MSGGLRSYLAVARLQQSRCQSLTTCRVEVQQCEQSPTPSENESGNPRTTVEPRERASCPLPLAEAWSGLVGRAWAQCLPPCRPSPQCGPAAQGGAGTTGVWLWLVRDTRLGRVPVKVKDTYLGLELLNRSILKSKYFVWHFDS